MRSSSRRNVALLYGVLLCRAAPWPPPELVWNQRQLAPAKRVTFIHIPKNGGTAVTRALRAAGASRNPIRTALVSGVGCSSHHTPIPQLRQSDLIKDTIPPAIAVLRHPYERAISQWMWGSNMWIKNMGYEKTAASMNLFIRDAISNASMPARWTKMPGPSSKIMIAKRNEHAASLNVSRVAYECLGGGRYLQDCHWIPQAEYIWDNEGNRLIDVLFCLGGDRDLISDISTHLYGVKDALPNQRLSERREGETFEYTVATIAELQKSKNSDGRQCQGKRAAKKSGARSICDNVAGLEASTLAALNRHYAADFDKLGFQRVDRPGDLQVYSTTRTLTAEAAKLIGRRPGSVTTYSLSVPGAPHTCYRGGAGDPSSS